MSQTKILITGHTGFVGRALHAHLATTNAAIYTPTRQSLEIAPDTDWSSHLAGIDVVIHLAARAHILRETEADPLEAFRRVNTHASKRLAEACVNHGVRRLVFVSTIGVHGATSDTPFTEESPIAPVSPYAQSKWEAEEALRALAPKLQTVIVRPPLVHGPHVKGNFLRLLNWVARGVPLPFASVRNARSFVGVDNLADFLAMSATAEAAASQTFLVSDGEDVSTPELLRRIGRYLDRPARLVPCPIGPMRLAAKLVGRGEDVDRLFGSLQVDASKARRVLDWHPPRTLDQGLESMCGWYASQP